MPTNSPFIVLLTLMVGRTPWSARVPLDPLRMSQQTPKEAQ
jgi:hypothetical protein